MFVHAIDDASATLLAIYVGAKDPDDVNRYAESVARVDRMALAQDRGALIVVIRDPPYPTPNSADRRRFAQVKDGCRAAPTLLILVTASPILRSTITAVSWLSPQDERYRIQACETFAETLTQAKAFRSDAAVALQRMERKLRPERVDDARPLAAH